MMLFLQNVVKKLKEIKSNVNEFLNFLKIRERKKICIITTKEEKKIITGLHFGKQIFKEYGDNFQS